MTEGLRPNNGQLCSDVWYSLGNSILCPTKGTTKQELLVLPSSEREYPFKKGVSSEKGQRENLTVSWQILVIQTLEQLVPELETAMSNSSWTDPSDLTCEHVWVHWRPAHHSSFWRNPSHSHWNSWQFYADTRVIRLHWQIEHQLCLQILPVKREGERKIRVNNIWK